MPIDTSIYQAIKPVQIDPMGSAEGAMKLSQLGLQMQTQQAMRQAYGENMGQDGQLNQQGFINSIGRVNPQAAMQFQQNFAAMNKQKAEAQIAQTEALDKQLSQVMPTLEYVSKMPEEQRAQAWPKLMQTLRAQNVDTSRIGDTYDPDMFATALRNGQLAQAHLNAMKTQSEIATAPIQRNAELFGSRSPTNALTEQYNHEMTPVRGSQQAMNQMLKNYTDKSPQGDASLVLNAFKIKFPTAPDVNSLDQLEHAAGATDQMKSWVSQHLTGLKSPQARADLMRDAIATWDAQYGSYQGTAKKYQAMAQARNAPLGGMTYEPAFDETTKQTEAFKKDLGPYVPPTERGGLMAGITKGISRLAGADNGAAQKADNDGVAYAAPTGGKITAHDAAALKWLKTADPTSPDAFAVRAKLKRQGLLK